MIQKLYHITVFFPHIIKNQQPFRNAETHAKVVVFQGSQVIFHPLRSPSIGFFQAWRLAPFYPDHFNPHLNTFGNATITLNTVHGIQTLTVLPNPISFGTEVEKVKTFTQAAFQGPKIYTKSAGFATNSMLPKVRDSRQIQY